MSNDFMKDMMDAQKTMMDSWQAMYKNATNQEENPFAKGMNDYFEMQKKYMDAMSGKNPFDATQIFSDYFKSPTFDPKAFEFFTSMQKMYMDQMNRFGQMANIDFSQNPFMNNQFMNSNPFMADMSKYFDASKWSEGMETINTYFDKMKQFYNPLQMGKAFDPATKDLLEKMFKANTYYLNLYKFWKDLENTQLKPASEEMQSFAKDLLGRYNAMFGDMVMPMIPDELQAFAKDPAELLKSYFKVSGDFLAPWTTNFDELRDLLVEGTLADSSKIGEFFELWKAQFDKTFGAMILSPTVGMNRDMLEQQNKAFDTFINLMILGVDFSTRINAVQSENLGSMVERYFEMVEKGTQPQTFNEFFEYWSGQVEDVFEAYFATDEYSKLIGEVSSASVDYRIEMHKLVEKYLSDTPIVTRSEMNSVYKTVYDLKKELKAMKKANKEAAAAPAATPAAKEVKTEK